MVSIHKPRTIREGILVAFALFAIIALGSVAATAGIFTGIIGANTSDQASAALTAQVQNDMKNKTYDYSRILQAQFNKTAKDLDTVAEAVSNVFAPNFEFGARRSYYHVDTLNAGTGEDEVQCYLNGTPLLTDVTFPYNIPPDVVYNSKIGDTASQNYSDYLLYYDTYNRMGKNEYNFTGPEGELINRTNHLDPIFRDILAQNPAAAWIYIDYKIGVQRTFPWAHTDTSIFGKGCPATNRNDYKNSAYYINAQNAGGKVVWTSPEIDPYMETWYVSASRALYNGSNFIGCVGIDFRLDVLSETVGSIKMFDSGYGFLINGTGAVISHPNVAFDPEAEEATQIEDVEDFFGTGTSQISLATLTSGRSGIAAVTNSSDVKFYLAYAPVTLSDNSNYTLGIIVTQEEALAPVQALQDKIMLNLGIQLGVIFGILGAVLFAAISVGIKTSDSIVRPITKLTDLALQLSTEDVKKTAIEKLDANFDRDLGTKDDEIGSLARSFKNLVKMVQEEGKTEKKGTGSTTPAPE